MGLVLASAAWFSGPRLAQAAETRFEGDDVRITLDDAGLARIEHAFSWRVSGTTLRGFDISGVEPEAILEPGAAMTIDGETTSGVARVERKADNTLRVVVDGAPKASRGERSRSFLLRVAYSVDLVKAHEVSLDGVMWKLSWTAPAAQEGYDGARVVFDVPASPTAPKAIAGDGATPEDSRLVTLRRTPERDELEIQRPHISRSEGAVWTARVDPRAFPRVVDPTLRPVIVENAPAPSPESDAAWLVGLAAGLIFGAVARAKAKSFAAACERAKVVARGFLPIGPGVRIWGAGLSFGMAIVLELRGFVVGGAFGVVAAMAFAAHRAPEAIQAPRGPGKWLALSPDEAFARSPDAPGSKLDVATRAGKWTFGALLLVTGVAAGLLSRLDLQWAFLVPMDAAPLLALWLTGSRAFLPPDRVREPARTLASIYGLLRRDGALRVAPWARLPAGSGVPDELRLLVVPRSAMPGVIGIEVGMAWASTPVGHAGEAEVLVRVHDASAAAARLVALAPRARAVTGRKPEERVLCLLPSAAGRAGAVALVRRLSRELRDRRTAVRVTAASAWEGVERRLPPNERLRLEGAPA